MSASAGVAQVERRD